MAKRKVKEIFEDKLVAEIYEKVRESDGKRFYDVVIFRKYYDGQGAERRTPAYHLQDMLSMHILAVHIDRYIRNQLWHDRNTPAKAPPKEGNEVTSGNEAVDDAVYIEAD